MQTVSVHVDENKIKKGHQRMVSAANAVSVKNQGDVDSANEMLYKINQAKTQVEKRTPGNHATHKSWFNKSK